MLVQKRFYRVAGAWGSLFKNEGAPGKTVQKGEAKAGGDPHQSIPWKDFHGDSREAFRPPHPWPYAECRAADLSLLKRDPHVPAQTIRNTVNLNS